jgi:hypothetical protein
MLLIIAILLLAAILIGVGAFAVHILLWLGIILLVIWLLGFLFRAAESGGRRRGRWYRW